MMSSLECYRKAVRCEELARASDDETNRRVLAVASRQWRYLGDTAAVHAARIAGYYRASDVPDRKADDFPH